MLLWKVELVPVEGAPKRKIIVCIAVYSLSANQCTWIAQNVLPFSCCDVRPWSMRDRKLKDGWLFMRFSMLFSSID